MVKNVPTVWETQVRSLGWEDPLEEEMATPSSIPTWEIPWTEEPGGLQSMGGSQSRTRLSDFHSLTLRPLGSITTSEWVSLAAPAQKRQEPVLPMVEPQPLHSTQDGWSSVGSTYCVSGTSHPHTHSVLPIVRQVPPHPLGTEKSKAQRG